MRRKKERRPLAAVGVEAPSRKYFQGETMVCHLCERKQESDPALELQWRCIELDGRPVYFCPSHFPPDGAGVAAFEQAYEQCLLSIVQSSNQQPSTSN